MTTYYLRVEGVNIGSVLQDTSQLSVVRGGSLLLRKAVKDVESLLKRRSSSAKALSTGASIGLFQFEADSDQTKEVEPLCCEIVDYLNKDPNYGHFTFVVDIQKEQAGFLIDKEAVLARNRFRQMQQLSLAMPNKNGSIHEPCEWDGVRPGNAYVEVRRDQDERLPVSASIATRHDYGRDQKQRFYHEETKENGRIDPAIASLTFAHDLHDIADKSCFPKLEDKVAVIYLDGNKFSTIQRDHCKDPGTQKKWDDDVQGKRREFLKAFLLRCASDPDFKTEDGTLRIETLLWGGDEITLVVPAWRGFQTLHYFYEQSKDWKFHDALTHAGGIVFCQVKTPIYRMRELAKNLADHVKDRLDERRENLYEYMVLESIDYPTEPLKAFWERRFGAFACCRESLPHIPDWDKEAANLRKLLSGADSPEGRELPKGQVYALVRAALGAQDQSAGLAAFFKQFQRLRELLGKDKLPPVEDTLKKLFPSDCPVWPWLHLFELWDYIVPEREPGTGGKEVRRE